MQPSIDDNKITYLVLKHLEQFADKLPSLDCLKKEIENQHLLGESTDLDNNILPITFENVRDTYGDVPCIQLATLVDEGVNHLKVAGLISGENKNILQPSFTYFVLPVGLRMLYSSLYDCLIDYCKLLGEQNKLLKLVGKYSDSSESLANEIKVTYFDVQLHLPKEIGMGIILTPTDKGVFVKAFSKTFSVAKNSGKIQIGDQITAINGHPVATTLDAKKYGCENQDPILSFTRSVTTDQGSLFQERKRFTEVVTRISLIEKNLQGHVAMRIEPNSLLHYNLSLNHISMQNESTHISSHLLCSNLHFLRSLSGHYNAAIYGLALDQSERLLFTGADDQLIKIWDITSGNLLRTIRGHRSKITDLVINKENSVLASSSEDGRVMFWDITGITMKEQSLAGSGGVGSYRYLGCCCLHSRFVCQMRYEPIQQLLFSVADDGYVHAWNVGRIDPLNHHSGMAYTESDLCVLSFYHGKVGFGRPDANTGSTALDNSVLFCDISPDGAYLATGASDGVVRIWRIPFINRNADGSTRRFSEVECSMLLVQTLTGHTKGVDTVIFAHNGRDLVTASEAEGNACIWRCSSDYSTYEKTILHCEINFSKCRSKVKLSNCLWSADDTYLISSSWLKKVDHGKTSFEVDIKLWNIITGNVDFIFNRESKPVLVGPISNMYLHPDNSDILVSCCWGGKICFWDLNKRCLLRELQNTHQMGHSNRYFLGDAVPILDFRFSTIYNTICAVDDDGSVILYGVDNTDNYRMSPCCQYFAHDYDALNDVSRLPLDEITSMPPELVPNGPLLDSLRMPYMFQQLQNDVDDAEWVKLRVQEVRDSDNKLTENARQEKVMHEQNETALAVADNQELLDEIEGDEPVDEPDNDEFSLDLSDEEEEEGIHDVDADYAYDDASSNDNDPTPSRRDTTESVVSSGTARSRTTRTSARSRSSVPEPDIYSRTYRTRRSRTDEHARESDIIASDDDLGMVDDEDDFELRDEELEEEEIPDMEEDDIADVEEEEEDVFDDFSDYSSAAEDEKPKTSSHVKEAPKEKKEKLATASSLIDITRIHPKKRVLTREVFDTTYVKSSNSPALCALCHTDEKAVSGGFVSSYPIQYKGSHYFVHVACALCSQGIARTASDMFNIAKTSNSARKTRCATCGQFGATICCEVMGCLNRYHFPCAVANCLLSDALKNEPHIDEKDYFLCAEHAPFASDSFITAGTRANVIYDQEWLRHDSPSKFYVPQLGDHVVYFPQGHLQQIVTFGDSQIPFLSFSCCACEVIGVRYDFPHHLCCCSSILLCLQLKVVGIPTNRDTNAVVTEFERISGNNVEFEAVIRKCDLPDYIVNYDMYKYIMARDWKTGDHFDMEFLDTDGNTTNFGGTILRLLNNPNWHGSPWEGAEIRWDGEIGSQIVSLFETRCDDTKHLCKLMDPVYQNKLMKSFMDISNEIYASAFIDPVPTSLPDLVYYDAMVPVKMELSLIIRRLTNSFYHTTDALLDDIALIAVNCTAYNDAGSELVQQAQKLRDSCIEAVHSCCEGMKKEPIELAEREENVEVVKAVDEVCSELEEKWKDRIEVLKQPLPKYLVNYYRNIQLSPHPILWSNITYRRNTHTYHSLTEFYIDLILLITTVNAFHSDEINEMDKLMRDDVITAVRSAADHYTLDVHMEVMDPPVETLDETPIVGIEKVTDDVTIISPDSASPEIVPISEEAFEKPSGNRIRFKIPTPSKHLTVKLKRRRVDAVTESESDDYSPTVEVAPKSGNDSEDKSEDSDVVDVDSEEDDYSDSFKEENPKHTVKIRIKTAPEAPVRKSTRTRRNTPPDSVMLDHAIDARRMTTRLSKKRKEYSDDFEDESDFEESRKRRR